MSFPEIEDRGLQQWNDVPLLGQLPVNVTNEPLDWGGGHHTNIGPTSAGSFVPVPDRPGLAQEGA